MNTTTRIPIVLMSVEETAQAVSISVKTVRSLIRQGRLRAVNFGTRMTRIYLQDLLEIANLSSTYKCNFLGADNKQ